MGPPSDLEFLVSDHDPQKLVSLLKSQLPHSIALLRRIQHTLAYPSPTAKFLSTLSVSDSPPDETPTPWLAAWVDLAAGPETQVIIYSSLQATSSSPPIEKSIATAQQHHQHHTPSTLAASPNAQSQARAQLLALLSHIKNLPKPPSTPGGSPSPNPPGQPPFLVGHLHTGLFALLTASGEYDKEVSLPEMLPALRVHRLSPPYIKYLFSGAAVTPTPGSSESDSAPIQPPYQDYRFVDRHGRLGILPHHLDLVRGRSSILRSRETLTKLPGMAIYDDRRRTSGAGAVGTTDVGVGVGATGDGDSDAVQEELPIGWAFLSLDGSLGTLHVEPEYRGRGLAEVISRETMRRGMREGGIWREVGEEGEVWLHSDVAVDNGASRRVMEKLGGEIGWTNAWTALEVL